jgi:exopolysaccharide biosynthesis protein
MAPTEIAGLDAMRTALVSDEDFQFTNKQFVELVNNQTPIKYDGIKDGKLSISDTAEMIVINNKTSRPRSAIGFTNNNLVLLLAVEGDNTVGGYDGVNLLDLSNIMASLGCQDAINLDGGGSTSMVVSSQQLVRPGDNGIERPVVSAVLIKKK